MHFCIPVSQQRPDPLGGRYVVRWGPGSDGAGGRSVTWRGPGSPARSANPGRCVSVWQLYSVYLDGYLFCRVRYSQLHRWNEQVSQFEAGEEKCAPAHGTF